MREEIAVENTRGPIRLEGDKYDSVLYLNGVPIQFVWIREIGSTWRYQIAKSVDERNVIEDRSFSNFVKFGYLKNDVLSVQFEYIINKLASGNYSLEVGYLAKDLDLVESQDSQKKLLPM